MGAAAVVAFTFTALIWCGVLVLATQALLRRREPSLEPNQRRNVGYALFGLLVVLLYGALAYATPFLAGPLGVALGLAGGLLYAGTVLIFPGLGDALGLWVERTGLRSQYKAQRLIEEVKEAAPGLLDLEPLATMILERTVQTLEIRWGVFALWDRTVQELHVIAAQGLDEAGRAHWPADHPLTRWLLAGQKEKRSEALPDTQPANYDGALDTVCIVPIRLREEPVGVFLYGPHTGGEPLSATERNLLNLLGRQTTAAVANASLFNQVARARREWLQTFDALSDGIFLHDRQGRILRANRALARLVDRPFDHIISRPWFELIPAGPEPRLACYAKGASEYDLGYEGNRTLHITLSSLEGDEFCVHVVRDVTEERAMQLQLAQAEKLAAIGQMLSGVAHELNNPLTTIIGFSELLQESDVSAQTRTDLERICRQAKRCSRIVQSLLTFARQSRIQMAEVDINALLEQTLEFMQPQLESHHITVELDLAPDLPHTLADSGQLQQLFLNLCTNALQAMSGAHGQGALQISSRATPAVIRVSVRDDGPGIPPELRNRIFDPFFTTKGVGEGTGLGLSICYGIVREHGGKIWVESEPGQGATFYVELPLRHASASPTPEPTVAAAKRGRCILLVEDEEPIVALMTRVLEPAGHRILTASDGEQGLLAIADAIARGHMPDLIVADLKMPHLDGPGFYDRVRQAFPQLAHRFLFITGDAVGVESQSFLAATGLPHLGKPFGVQEIGQAIARALAKQD